MGVRQKNKEAEEAGFCRFGVWRITKAYSTEDAAALEQAFVLGVPRVVPVCKGVNEVNLDSMKQINVKTRVERPVTRL